MIIFLQLMMSQFSAFMFGERYQTFFVSFVSFSNFAQLKTFFLWLYVSERKLFTTQLGSERRDNASERTYYPNIAQKGVIEETSAK